MGNNSEIGLKLIEYYMIMVEFNEERKQKKGVNYWKKRIVELTEEVANHNLNNQVFKLYLFVISKYAFQESRFFIILDLQVKYINEQSIKFDHCSFKKENFVLNKDYIFWKSITTIS